MKNEQTLNLAAETTTLEYEPPTLTTVGDARDVVLGIPMAGWDWRGFAMLQFEFESDEE
jgi:hypothetical protein